MDDARVAGVGDVGDRASRMMPVPGVENDTHVRAGVFRQLHRVGHVPDERFGRRPSGAAGAEVERPEELDAEA